MHIALSRKKTSHESEKNFEDKLTSMFFGTLQYLPSKAIACFFINLFYLYKTDLNTIGNIIDFIQNDDISFKFDFWPNILDKGRIEPDLLITATRSNTLNITFLIECKWDSKESSTNQLQKQWNALLGKYNANDSIHIYLVKHSAEGKEARDNNLASMKNNKVKAIWEEKLHVITWYDVMNALKIKTYLNHGIEVPKVYSIWSDNLLGMFNRIGINVFNGFNHLKNHNVSALPKSTVVFWQAFSGFNRFSDEIERMPLSTLFWNSHTLII